MIEELGLLRKAAGWLGMSYRYTWGYPRELEEDAGFRIPARQTGGGPPSGMRITPRVWEFLNRYWLLHRRVDSEVGQQFARVFREQGS